MILERRPRVNIIELKERHGQLFRTIVEKSDKDDQDDALIKLAELMQLYNAAMKEISTKLEVLDDEFQIVHKHNPIHHLECRIKGLTSIYQKLEEYKLPPSIIAAREHIYDIAGIRVICNFVDDIYSVEKMLLSQSDVTLVKRRDYIANPKENGYRSLHIVVKVPVFLSNRTEMVPVEIQLRTIAMDYWASLEHMLRYKNDKCDLERFSPMLLECADKLAETEKTMQFIREQIEE